MCSFVGAIIGDMPSQQKLAGCLSHQANKPCRYCLIDREARSNLDYNVIEFGRYGEQLSLDSKRIRNLKTKNQQSQAGKELGIHDSWHLVDVLGKQLTSCALIMDQVFYYYLQNFAHLPVINSVSDL